MPNQMTVICTTHGERRPISIGRQKKGLESKLGEQTDAHIAFPRVVQNFDIKSYDYLFLLNISTGRFFILIEATLRVYQNHHT